MKSVNQPADVNKESNTIYEPYRPLLDPLITDPKKFLEQLPHMLKDCDIQWHDQRLDAELYHLFLKSIDVALNITAEFLRSSGYTQDTFWHKVLTIENEHRLWRAKQRDEWLDQAAKAYEREKARIRKLLDNTEKLC